MLRDEVPNHRLATLAAHFHASTTPSHRALADARATVDVLHALLERVGNLGVHTLEDLVEVTRRVSPQRRSKRLWAQSLPEAPGVYVFVCDTPSLRQYLYVGTSGNIRRRVRTYFTAAEKRPRIDEMVRVATGVEATVCRTALEAEVLELRLIAAHAPRYNRRSKYPERQHWVKLTRETFPRLSVVRAVTADGCRYFGPFRGRAAAQQALLAVYDATPVRQCTERLSARTPSGLRAGRRGALFAPANWAAAESYADLVAETDRVLGGTPPAVVGAAERRLPVWPTSCASRRPPTCGRGSTSSSARP
jgi:DNA polymerase-3 subunit epsilon